jgi:GST-like protein
MSDSRPDILLYTAPTMNGWKPLISRPAAGIPSALAAVDFARKEQTAPE